MLFRECPKALFAGMDRSTAFRIVALGVVMYALAQGAQFVVIDIQSAATTSLVLSLTPLIGTMVMSSGFW